MSQVSTRLITFVLNLITARLLTVDAYGVRPCLTYARPQESDATPRHEGADALRSAQLSSVQFHLINTTILFLSREGLRRGCLRAQQAKQRSALSTLRTAALCIPFGLAVTAAVCAISLRGGAASLSDPYAGAVGLQGKLPVDACMA